VNNTHFLGVEPGIGFAGFAPFVPIRQKRYMFNSAVLQWFRRKLACETPDMDNRQ
jgi:hypothetical protein